MVDFEGWIETQSSRRKRAEGTEKRELRRSVVRPILTNQGWGTLKYFRP